VLNLRRLKDDQKKAKHTALSLYHIPMKAGAIDPAEVMKALTLIRDRKGPILIHCWHGSDRTGMLCAMYRMVFQGWNKDDAVNEMTKGNFGFHSGYKNIVDFIRNADVGKYKKDLFGAGAVIASGTADSAAVSAIR
jgi:protein tyrosine/serine phosphatase